MMVRGYKIKPGAGLRGANFCGADLSKVDLYGANLSSANLRRADLSKVNLSGASLSKTNLLKANLSGANLSKADLSGADLSIVNFHKADLRGADLSDSNLYAANFYGANLSGANLSKSTLYAAKFRKANLTHTVLDPTASVPELPNDEITAAGFKIKGDQVWGWRTQNSQGVGNTEYKPGKCYVAPVFSVCCHTGCHPGIYLAGKRWLSRTYPRAAVVRCYCLRSELIHAVGPEEDNWRCKRLWIVEDKL